jgi:hypothetical protein
MSRILVVGVVALLLFGGVLAADLALQNPDLEPGDNATDDRQQQFAEFGGSFVELGVPVAMFGLVAGLAIAAVRVMGGG